MLAALALTFALSAVATPAVPPQGGAASPPKRFEFTTFGANRALSRADRIVEGEVASTVELSIGTAIVRFTVTRTLLPLEEALPRESLVLLAHRGEFRDGQRYLVLLQAFEGGDRFVALGRIASGERDYAAKRDVLAAFAAVDRIASETERLVRIRALLLDNLASAQSFTRWNALAELRSLAAFQVSAFTPADRARIVAVRRESRDGAFRREVTALLRTLGITLDEDDRG
jgi:hypothetical protein